MTKKGKNKRQKRGCENCGNGPYDKDNIQCWSCNGINEKPFWKPEGCLMIEDERKGK